MSHESLRQAASYLANSENPLFQEGGKKLALVADILLKDHLIPESDSTIKFLTGEAAILPPMIEAKDFDYDTVRGEFIVKGKVVGSIPGMRKEIFERLLLSPGEAIHTEDIVRNMYGFVDQSGMDSFKIHLSRLRKSLPTTQERALEIIESLKGSRIRYNHFPKED